MTEAFTLPSVQRFQRFCKDRKLDEVQVKVLGGILWRAHLKFRNGRETSIDGDERKRILKLLKKFQASLNQLLWSLDISANDIAKYSKSGFRFVETDVGEKATSRLLAAVAGREKLKEDPGLYWVAFAKYGTTELGDELLNVKQSIDLLIDVTVKDRGGRPADLVRNFLVKELCMASPELIKKDSASTANGAFAKLVEGIVVTCCDLPGHGLEELIERNVSLYKKTK